jgi:hypothetical protein
MTSYLEAPDLICYGLAVALTCVKRQTQATAKPLLNSYSWEFFETVLPSRQLLSYFHPLCA